MALNDPIDEKKRSKAKQRYAFDMVALPKDICKYDNETDYKRRIEPNQKNRTMT